MKNENIGLSNQDGEVVALKRVGIQVTIQHLLIETDVRQEYRNDLDHNIEAVYTFPVPVGAVLLGFEINLGDKTYHGQVVERIIAEVQYEEAIEQGNSAFRLQKVGEGMFTASLGNINAGETLHVRYRYAQTLTWNGTHLPVRIPTVLAPRYGVPIHIEPWQHPETSVIAAYPLDVTVTVFGELARGVFSCASHGVETEAKENETIIRLVKGATLDRDFVLDISSDNNRPLVSLATQDNESVAVTSFLPQLKDSTERPPQAFVIVVDCSGSMNGDSITQAKAALMLILDQLRPEDGFEIIAFGTEQRPFTGHVVAATRKNRELATRFVDVLVADMGGTEMAQALDLALRTKSPIKSCDLLLITDGEVWNIESTVEAAKKLERRIFTVGVGSAVAEDTVRKLAENTGGACELVAPNEDMTHRITRHFERMRQMRVMSVVIDWSQAPLWQAAVREGALFVGDTHTVFAGFGENKPTGEVKITLHFENGAETTQSIGFSGTEGLEQSTIIRMGAAQRIRTLPQADRIPLALKYQLLSDDTDFLIVVERGESMKAADLPQLHVVPNMLATGWSGVGSALDRSAVINRSNSSVPYEANFAQIDAPAKMRKRFDPSVDSTSYVSRAAHFEERRSSGKNHRVEGESVLTPLQFIMALNAKSRWTFTSWCPSTLSQLRKQSLPESVIEALEELMSLGWGEQEVVLAFLCILQQSAVGQTFSGKCTNQLGKLSLKVGIPTEIMEYLADRVGGLNYDAWDLHDVPLIPQPAFLGIRKFLRNKT